MQNEYEYHRHEVIVEQRRYANVGNAPGQTVGDTIIH
jgi:hypothetical protein